MKDLLTVSEFAKEAGISKQAVYSRLNKGLNKFVQVVDGKKMLKSEALQEYLEQGKVNGCSSFSQGFNQPLTTLELLQQTIDLLQNQLAEKDKQIETLTEALKTEQLHASQAQALHAGTIQTAIEGRSDDVLGQQKKPGLFRRIFTK
jgi:DNA-binding transcriptional MerR regulator